MKRALTALPIAILLAVAAPAAQAVTFTPGAPGAGDPFFPLAGNGGYEVRHYSLRSTSSRRPSRSTPAP